MMTLPASKHPITFAAIKAEIAAQPLTAADTIVADYQEWAFNLAKELGVLRKDIQKLLPSPVDTPAGDFDTPLEEQIVDALREKGPLTYKALYAALPHFPHLAVYRAVRDELLPIERVLYSKAPGQQSGVLMVNDGWSGNVYLERLLDADPSLAQHEQKFQEENAEALDVYERIVLRKKHGGKRLRAGRTWPAIKKYGLIKTWELVVTNPAATDGFAGLKEVRPDLTAEAIIDRWPDKFAPDAVKAARKRLGKVD